MSTRIDAATYRALRTLAARVTRHRADADDLVQDVLLAALQAGRADPAWLAGVLRRQAAMAVRTAVRRRRREQADVDVRFEPSIDKAPETPSAPVASWLPSMPPAARRVALLALHGLDAAEIRWILRVSPAALRQRLTSIRKALAQMPTAARAQLAERIAAHRRSHDPRLPAGRLRRHILQAMRRAPALGTHDPDGHMLLLRCDAHVPPAGGNKE